MTGVVLWLKLRTHWERQTSPNAEISDLDENEIRATIRESIKIGRSTIANDDDIEKFLVSQNLYENGHLTNAALILFAKEPLKFLPQVSVRLSVFQDSKTSNEFIYDSIFSGNFFSNINKILHFLTSTLPPKANSTIMTGSDLMPGSPGLCSMSLS